MTPRLVVLSLVIVSMFVTQAGFAESWSQFRGATGDGISTDSSLPTKWSSDTGVKWVTEVSGRANSSPAVTDRRVDLTTQKDDSSLWVLSFDRSSGKLIREVHVGDGKLAAKGPANLYAHRHNAATPTPIADDNNIWAFFGSGLLVCVDANSGKVKWKRDLTKDYGDYDITFGMGSSPRLWGDRIYVACMTKGPSYVVAFDKQTGKEVWKTARRLPAKDDGPDAYSTPVIATNGGKPSLLISGSDHVNAYDLDSGKQLWARPGLTIPSPYGRVIASPVEAGNLVIATSGNPGGKGLGRVIAVSANGRGSADPVWQYDKTIPDSSTPVVLGSRVFMVTDNGLASCLDLESGELVWKKRLSPGPYHASLVAGDGKVYFLSTTGVCTVVEAAGDAKVLAENHLEGMFYATPAISNGIVYLRSYERLYSLSGSPD